MEFCWHGSGAYSLRQDGFELLVDPYLSPPGTYGGWYIPNPSAPPWERFAGSHRPGAVFITHGHFDHFDPEALKRIEARFQPVFVGSPEAVAALCALVGVEPGRTLGLEPGEERQVGPFRLRAAAGVHWLTGEEGSAAAAKLAGRPDRYGVMPCGGPMLSLLVEAGGLKLYLSGDTEVSGVPRARVDVAVLNIAGSMLHPATKVECFPALTVDDIPEVISRLGPRLIIPVHYDFAGFKQPVDVERLKGLAGEMEGRPEGPRMWMVGHHRWMDISEARA
ncbi:MAG: MBL fold metallo-hydrolase [Acetobacteraceae bacterium]|nr:MBL fold metallo-hydrolase [Acetobacteraceae bacterium]